MIFTSEDDQQRLRKGEQQQQKSFPSYNDDFGEDFVFEDVVEGFTISKNMHGDFSNLAINHDFVVPTVENNVFGELDAAAAFDVDASSRAAAAIAAFDEQDRAEESKDLIASEIKRLQEAVESELVVDTLTEQGMSSRAEWSEHLSGMKLGHTFQRIRNGNLEVKHLPERKAKLDAIGFDWGVTRKCALMFRSRRPFVLSWHTTSFVEICLCMTTLSFPTRSHGRVCL